MINILKMDLQRFRSNKIMYIMFVVFIYFQLFGIYMWGQYEGQLQPGEILPSAMNESQFIQSVLSQTPSWILLYVAIFTVSFYMSEFNSGFYKNYISLKNARIYSILSKIIIQGLFTLLLLVLMVITDLIGRSLVFDQAEIGDLGYFTKLILGIFLLHWAFSVVILCISIISKNLIVSIVIGVVLGLNIFGFIIGALESLFGSNMNLASYLLVNTTISIKDFNNISDILHVFSVAIIFMLVFSFIALRYKVREDLR